MDARCELLHNGQYGVIDPSSIHAMIAERAYLKAEKRGFVPGYEMEDWLEAEREVNNQCHYWKQEVF